MSYAIETKKRKFDRILEALTDGAASTPPSAPASPSRSSINASTTSISLYAASDSSKRRRITPTSKTTAPSTSPPVTLSGHYLPSSRAAFLQRLETFRHVTQWHIPSTDPINAAAWAKRGWTCVDTDTVACGVCKERLYIDLDVDKELLKSSEKEGDEGADEEADADDEDSFAISSEIYDNIVKRYQDMIVTAHAESCLWRKRGCDASIQRIEGLLNTTLALSGLRTRYDSLASHLDEIPQVEPLPLASAANPHELDRFRLGGQERPHVDTLRLAVCGWARKCDDVIECRHCFRSLGLWLYRGESPAIEKLDAIDNHLEYCPWRSAEAQDTEIQTGHSRTTTGEQIAPKKERVPGWVLVYQAIAKDNRQKSASAGTLSTAASETFLSENASESTTPEQREKRMKDLLRRIKEIKKPFNVKALLKRKDKPKA
ncbi:uncharacterized protein Z520_05739 [Fonsecaea multimorphosa CBS 102226]|uniref:C3HC-type domain-containing protein n=1 Tax=Fonsecaea multimorphosa CBS 102226 TaxID=1442371 RepID=A0A0D2KP45_9EURO|nr:uncharacterized protein Z520_05739 [Fonsecaea multimorphosa CBS 102226]KIX98438.1 hypothetical protein Z520_05739 [Fonsecaea multimorphosa CBS 102226]OAL24633.1 hypothetical protein AYO22_05422 [Fonsecaea multimorphosa]